MFGFFRRKWMGVAYFEELKTILLEEEALIKEWYKDFMRPTSSVHPRTGGQSFAGPSLVEDYKLKKIWLALSRLHKESRKIEEIKRLADREEEKLSARDKMALRQLRRKLGWKPVKLAKGYFRYLSFSEREYFSGFERTYDLHTQRELDFDDRKYKSYIKKITRDEVKFWNYLYENMKKLKAITEKMKEYMNQARTKWAEIPNKIDKGDQSWVDDYLAVMGTDTTKEEILSEEEKWKNIIRGICKNSPATESIKAIYHFSIRAENIIGDIKKRLKATKP